LTVYDRDVPRQIPKHTFEEIDLDVEVVIVDGERFTEADAEALSGAIAAGPPVRKSG